MITSNIYTDFHISGPRAALSELMSTSKATHNSHHGICVMLVDRGQTQIRIDETTYPLSPSSVVVLMPFHTMVSLGQSDDFEFRYLYFDFDFMTDFPLVLHPQDCEWFNVDPCIWADEVSFRSLGQLYDTLLNFSLQTEHPHQIEIVKAQVFIFISELMFRFAHSVARSGGRRSNQLTADFFRLLHSHHNSERSLAFYADRLCVTTKYLSKVIRRVTAHTVYFWIEEFTVKEAKQLLRSSDATITEIAEGLNFANSSFFAKFFRRHTGYSPTAFRHNHGSQKHYSLSNISTTYRLGI